MIRALITGNLFGDPQARTSQAGKAFTTAKVRADGKDGSAVWVSLVAFNELAERLAGLKANNDDVRWIRVQIQQIIQPAHFTIPKMTDTRRLRLLFPNVVNRGVEIGGIYGIISR